MAITEGLLREEVKSLKTGQTLARAMAFGLAMRAVLPS
jgi:hypothetical protein